VSAKTRWGLIGIAAACIAGCGRSSAPVVAPSAPVAPPVAGSETVTFYVKDMGERLNLL